MPNRPGNQQKCIPLLGNIKKEYEVRAGGSEGSEMSTGTSNTHHLCGVSASQGGCKELKRQQAGARGWKSCPVRLKKEYNVPHYRDHKGSASTALCLSDPNIKSLWSKKAFCQ